MKIALFQMKIQWGDVETNLSTVGEALSSLQDPVDLMVLPEMFSTGFDVDLSLANDSARVLQQMKEWSRSYGLALAFTLMTEDGGHYFNRAYFVTPEGECHTYDKRHLFRMGKEGELFQAGSQRVVVSYKGWNILLQTCYDLRFPVFSRCVDNDYDLILYMANWPVVRVNAWNALLPARAIENLSYVCGVNAVGVDTTDHLYGGHSMLVDMKGKTMAHLPETEQQLSVCELSLDDLNLFRKRFPAWKDADLFDVSI